MLHIYLLSVFFSKWSDLQAWNSSLVLPIFEYCYLNKFCKPCQSMFIGCKASYHNLASPTNVKQNLQTLMSSRKWCTFIQSLVLSKWASGSSSGFPENSGLKCDQFKCTNCYPCFAGCCACCAGSSWAGGSEGAGISGACGPASAILYLFQLNHAVLYSILSNLCTFNTFLNSLTFSFPLLLYSLLLYLLFSSLYLLLLPYLYSIHKSSSCLIR